MFALKDGINWKNERYRRRRDMQWLHGWQFPAGWEGPDFLKDGTEAGVWREGEVRGTYMTTEFVDIPYRRELQGKVLAGAPRFY